MIRLLLVEDEPDIREVLELSLRLDPNILLTSYGSAAPALAEIAERRDVFDIALLDYRLPEMTGIELHQRLRQMPQLSSLNTVIITACVTREYVALFEDHGVAGLIAKPFDPLTLAQEVRALAQTGRSKSKTIRWWSRQNNRFG